MAAIVSYNFLPFRVFSALFSISFINLVSIGCAGIMQKVPGVCNLKSCHSPSMLNTSVVYGNCIKENYTITDRCCHDSNQTIFGLDLSTCNLHSIPAMGNYSLLEWIALEDNPLEHHDTNVTQMEEFRGLNSIKYLSLPVDFKCPGGYVAWNKAQEEKNMTICEDELDVCLVDNSTFVCPHISHCVPNGPGLIQCQCDGDYYGYKCLRYGDFPMAIYYGTLCGCTVFLSVFLWLTQRRKARAIYIKRE